MPPQDTTTQAPADDFSALANVARGIPPAAGSAADQAAAAADQVAQAQAGQPAELPYDHQVAATLAGLFDAGADLGSSLTGLKAPRELIDDDVCNGLAVAWARVAHKRGWNLQAIVGDYGAEVAAVGMTVVIALKVGKACDAEAAALARDKARTVTASETPTDAG